MQVWQTAVLGVSSDARASHTHDDRRISKHRRTFCVRRCRTQSIPQSARSCKRSSPTGTDRPKARLGSIPRAARKGGTIFITGRSHSATRRFSRIRALFHPRPQRSAVVRSCFYSQPIRRIHHQGIGSLRLSHSRLISPQGDTAGASCEATGSLSARPLPLRGISLHGELAKTLIEWLLRTE